MTAAALTALGMGDAVPESFAGEVLGAYEHVCAVAVESALGGLVALAVAPSDAGPAGILLSASTGVPLAGLIPAGTVVRRAGATLTIGGVDLDLTGVPSRRSGVGGLRWDACSTPALDALEVVEAELRRVESALRVMDAFSAAARSRVATLLERLCRALASGDGPVVSDAAARLIGLGPGATPSGDDALMGVLLASLLMKRAEGERSADRLGAVVRDVVRAGAGRTTSAGRSYLMLACEGRFGSALRDLAGALCAGDADATRRHARRCLSVGHTSGADGLLGLTGALRAAHAARPVFSFVKGT